MKKSQTIKIIIIKINIKIMFEIGGVTEEIAREALRLAMHKLPIKCKFVKKESGESND